ncbi:MAG: hypothetical protein KDI90_11250 [Alphaproteobacteria bacterium]|nr:hypothetical protein [Alphaproteobacteria bacterium]MCB9975882.1 hypothetical protein [Rhodospirillales bacterium]
MFDKKISLYVFLTYLLFFSQEPCLAQIFEKELAVKETPIITNESLPEGWVVASDPELVKFGNTWWMFFNSIELNFKKGLPIHVLAASLPEGEKLSADPQKWKVHSHPVISPGAKGEWDERTIETTKYVYGYDATAKEWVGRLYYVGWPHQTDQIKEYQISFVQWSDKQKRWIKHGKPVITATEAWERLNGSSFLGDQSAWYEPGKGKDGADGTWHIWYQAVAKPKDGGTSLVHITSKDGIKWQNKKRLTHKVPFTSRFVKTGPFSIDVLVKDGQFYFVGFLYNQDDLSKQGLWITRSSTPDGSAVGDFSEWHPLIFENNGVWWHDSGLVSSKCHVTGLFAPTLREEDGKIWMFYHGYYRKGKVKDPCKDKSKNSGIIGRALVKDFDKIMGK